jgi:hypothetical protein
MHLPLGGGPEVIRRRTSLRGPGGSPCIGAMAPITGHVLALQRLIGNRAVASLLSESDAPLVADRVTGAPTPPGAVVQRGTSLVGHLSELKPRTTGRPYTWRFVRTCTSGHITVFASIATNAAIEKARSEGQLQWNDKLQITRYPSGMTIEYVEFHYTFDNEGEHCFYSDDGNPSEMSSETGTWSIRWSDPRWNVANEHAAVFAKRNRWELNQIVNSHGARLPVAEGTAAISAPTGGLPHGRGDRRGGSSIVWGMVPRGVKRKLGSVTGPPIVTTNTSTRPRLANNAGSTSTGATTVPLVEALTGQDGEKKVP